MTNAQDEERIAKEKEAVNAMRNAQANMRTAIDRIASLEFALKASLDLIDEYSKFIPENAYLYRSEVSIRDGLLERADPIRKKL